MGIWVCDASLKRLSKSVMEPSSWWAWPYPNSMKGPPRRILFVSTVVVCFDDGGVGEYGCSSLKEILSQENH